MAASMYMDWFMDLVTVIRYWIVNSQMTLPEILAQNEKQSFAMCRMHIF